MGRVGILIVGHLTLAEDLITTTKFLIGDLFGINSIYHKACLVNPSLQPTNCFMLQGWKFFCFRLWASTEYGVVLTQSKKL